MLVARKVSCGSMSCGRISSISRIDHNSIHLPVMYACLSVRYMGSLTDNPVQQCMIGIVFSNESEANNFLKKVLARKEKGGLHSVFLFSNLILDSAKHRTISSISSSPTKKRSGKPTKIDKSLISGPSHFKHVAHMGF